MLVRGTQCQAAHSLAEFRRGVCCFNRRTNACRERRLRHGRPVSTCPSITFVPRQWVVASGSAFGFAGEEVYFAMGIIAFRACTPARPSSTECLRAPPYFVWLHLCTGSASNTGSVRYEVVDVLALRAFVIVNFADHRG